MSIINAKYSRIRGWRQGDQKNFEAQAGMDGVGAVYCKALEGELRIRERITSNSYDVGGYHRDSGTDTSVAGCSV